MIGPILPGAEGLVEKLAGIVEYVLIDRMNYHYADWVYRKHELEYAMSDHFFEKKKEELADALKREGIGYRVLF
jgi:hypothetical protein